MKAKDKTKDFLKVGITITIYVILISTSFSSATISYSDSIAKPQTNNNYSNSVLSLEVLNYRFDFIEPKLEKITLNDTRFSRVVLPGCLLIGSVGKPALPVKSVRLVVPQKMDVADVTVTGESIEIDTVAKGVDLQEFPITPYQPQVPFCEFNSKNLAMDQEAYASFECFPHEKYYNMGVGECRGYKIVTMHLSPVQYIPVSGRLLYYPSLFIRVELRETGNVSSYYRASSADASYVRTLISNPEIIDTYDCSTQGQPLFTDGLCAPSDNYDYVLITNNDLNNTVGQEYNWSYLLEHRQNYSGLNTTKVTVEDIDSCPVYWNDTALFNDSAAHIREFIKDAYQNWGTQFVLLGGDWDTNNPDNQIVPARIFTGFEMLPDEYATMPCDMYYGNLATMPCDMYYSNLDGDWRDTEHDVWGGGVNSNANDLYAEVYVGRLTVNNAEHVSNVVGKIISYDFYIDTDFLSKAVFFGGNLGWPITTSATYMEELRNGTDPNFYECKGFLEWNQENLDKQFNISKRVYYDWGALIPRDYKILINNNDACIINHLSHGLPYYALDMYMTDLRSLTNSKYFFVYSQGCLCGRFTVGDSTEKILTCDSSENGAFAVVLNTGYGFGDPYTTNGTSQFLHRKFWHYMFNNSEIGQWTLGGAQAYSKDEISAYIGREDWQDPWAYTFYSAHLFGDPAQTIKSPIMPDHNIRVKSLDVPNHVKSQDVMHVNTTVVNTGKNNESNVTVSFRVDGDEIGGITILFLPSQATEDISFQWTPDVGVHMVTINVSVSGVTEDYYVDNELSQEVIVGVYNIDTGECFDAVQNAIDDPDTLGGHTIIVPPGTHLGNIWINKSISLIGRNRNTTIIDGNNSRDVISVIADRVNITGFIIRNGTNGVHVRSSENVAIKQNEICDNSLGIYVTDFSNNTEISYNNLHNNKLREKSMIHSNVTGDVSECNISDPMMIDNISLQSISLCYGAIKLENTTNARVICNDICDNYEGIRITVGSNGNLLYHNSFNNTDNAFDAGNGNHWDNGYPGGGNYWSDYNGSDECSGPEQNEPGPDGIGDIPYNIFGGSSCDRYPIMYPFDALVVNLHTGEIFQSIQNAIDDSDTSDGHIILVKNHIYYENIIIDKGINLVGEDKDTTIIDADYSGDVVSIVAEGVSISGFTIRNSDTDLHGIYIDADYTNISGNTIAYNGEGIVIKKNHTLLLENTVIYNFFGIDISAGVQESTIAKNVIANSMYGIYGERGPRKITIEENSIMENMMAVTIYGDERLPFCDMEIIGNNIMNSICGIDLIFVPREEEHASANCKNNNISGNRIYNNKVSIKVYSRAYLFPEQYDISNTTITENIITNTTRGLFLMGTNNTVAVHNTLERSGITISGNRCKHWNTHTIEKNTVNDKPIRYYNDRNNFVVPTDTSQVILANCTNSTIQNLDIQDVDAGVQIGFSSHNSIANNTVVNSTYDGIYLYKSDNNDIVQNSISNSARYGIVCLYGSHNNILWNIISNNAQRGVYLDYSDENHILGNTITKSNCGIYLDRYSENNNISANTITYNKKDGIKAQYYSDYNNITNNTITNNYRGIFFTDILKSDYPITYTFGSSYNTINGNTFFNNDYGVYIEYHEQNKMSNYNTIYRNNFNNTEQNAYDECSNTWYDESLGEGNYWSDYTDLYPDASPRVDDLRIWDTPYDILGGDNQDLYPFVRENGWLYILGDLDFDGDVDLADLAQLLAHYGMTEGATYEMGDLDGDGDVDISDLAALLANYGYGL